MTDRPNNMDKLQMDSIILHSGKDKTTGTANKRGKGWLWGAHGPSGDWEKTAPCRVVT